MPSISKRARGRPSKAAMEATSTLIFWADSYLQALQEAPLTGNWRKPESALALLKSAHAEWQLSIAKKDAS